MTQLHDSAKLQKETSVLTQSAISADRDLRQAEARVREQEAHVLRLIVQGAPTQVAEDLLRRLTATAEAMRARRRGAGR
ncbi:MAG TPA: hypothetical protein VFY92_11345 [Hyphomicrobiaceae bacterium]|nr:hypothetical protein [Hyphomicrobiaceae bacterium]